VSRVNISVPGGAPEPVEAPAPDVKKPAPRKQKESDNG
jgi:hypothetical protein